MPTTPTAYIDSLKEAHDIITGNTAPLTGQYYEHVYSLNDERTGVPTLGVTLYETQDNTLQQITPPIEPVQLNNLTDNQILELVQGGQQVGQGSTISTTQAQTVVAMQADTSPVAQEDGSLPLWGMFIFILLLGFVGFVYFIIRTWQDHQAQKLVMVNINKPPSTIAEVTQESNWHTDIEAVDIKLAQLLHSKGIVGETVSDQLKAIKPGQFAFADMAWEAHQGAKKLLVAHKSDVQESEIKRTLQLFKQVFAEHDVI